MVTIRGEPCREPESKLCGNQRAILALLNLPAPFITAAREEAGREGRGRTAARAKSVGKIGPKVCSSKFWSAVTAPKYVCLCMCL